MAADGIKAQSIKIAHSQCRWVLSSKSLVRIVLIDQSKC